MTDVTAYVMRTEEWRDNYNGNTSIYDIKSTTQDIWDEYIRDYRWNYQLDLEITYSDPPWYEITTSGDIWDRAREIDDWCENNLSGYSQKDVIIVADYWGQGSHSGGALSTAGGGGKVCVVDYDTTLDATWKSGGHELLHTHELLHMFIDTNDKEHYPEKYISGNVSVMFSPGSVTDYCTSGAPGDVVGKVSDCTKVYVRSWIDQNL